MAQKVAKVGITKQNGYLYFIDKKGDISRVKMARGGKKKKAKKKPAKRAAKRSSSRTKARKKRR